MVVAEKISSVLLRRLSKLSFILVFQRVDEKFSPFPISFSILVSRIPLKFNVSNGMQG